MRVSEEGRRWEAIDDGTEGKKNSTSNSTSTSPPLQNLFFFNRRRRRRPAAPSKEKAPNEPSGSARGFEVRCRWRRRAEQESDGAGAPSPFFVGRRSSTSDGGKGDDDGGKSDNNTSSRCIQRKTRPFVTQPVLAAAAEVRREKELTLSSEEFGFFFPQDHFFSFAPFPLSKK